MSDAILDPYSPRPTDPDADQVLDPYASKAGRHVSLAVTWETKAIARDLAPHLKSLVYADNLSGAADDLTLELEDREDLWSGDWRPDFGDKVVARLKAEAWFKLGPSSAAAAAALAAASAVVDPTQAAVQAAIQASIFSLPTSPMKSLRLGTFAHDEMSFTGPPHMVSLKCVSAPLATGLRRRKRTRTWQGVDLEDIATDIAKRASLRLDFRGPEGLPYKQAQQNDKSDLEFLQELCKENGRTLKVTESTIVVYDELTLDSGLAVGDIDLKGGNVLSWSFDSKDGDRYGSCHVTCFNPRTGKKTQGQFPPDGTTIKGLDQNGQTLELVINVSDQAQAQVRAAALLRNANRFATSGKLTTVGDPGLVAGVVFNLTNAGGFSGKFIITKAEHHPVGGYTCELEVRRCLEGY